MELAIAEHSVMGAILIGGECLRAVRSKMKAEDFSSGPCAGLFRAACRLADAGEPVDPVTILADAKSHGETVTEKFVAELMETTPSVANAEYYAQVVHEAAVRRRVAEKGTQLVEQARDETVSVSALLSNAIGDLQKIEEGQTGLLVSSEDAANEFLDYCDRVEQGGGAVVSTGYKRLDAVLGGGMVAEGLYILGARPGVGKTTLGLKIAEQVAKRGGVLFISLEMSREQLVGRRVADWTGLPISKVLNGHVTNEEMAEIGAATSEIAQTGLVMNLATGATVADIALMARSTPNLTLVVIDYLGLLQSETRSGSLYERVTANSNALKRLARSLGVPILCLAQLNRNSEDSGKPPAMSDLRDSGAIEQDADGIFLLNRAKNENAKPWEGELLEVHVAKNRHGATGRVTLTFYPVNGRVVE